MSLVQHHLNTQVCYRSSAITRRKAMVLADGTVLSVQAGWGLYCTPRDDSGPYTEVEVASSREIAAFAGRRDSGFDGNHVYAYVPVTLVEAEIQARGGILGYQEGMSDVPTMLTEQERAVVAAFFCEIVAESMTKG